MNPINQFIISALHLLPKRLMKPFAMRYMAGEALDDAARVLRALNSKGMMGTVDVLGENVLTKQESLRAVKACEEVLRAIYENHLDANLSIRLTQFGLKIDQEFCHSNVKNLLGIAKGYKNFVRMDMEDSTTTTAMLSLYERLRSEGFENTGVVIQAYLRRSEEDLKRLTKMKANVRFCKGIYVEPESIAFRNREEIRVNYPKLLRMLLDATCYAGVATHDDFLIQGARRFIKEMNLQKSDYEFQMLYGVRMKLRDQLVAEGQKLRVRAQEIPLSQETV